MSKIGAPRYEGTLVVRRKDGSIRLTVPISGELSFAEEPQQTDVDTDNLPEVEDDGTTA